MRPRSWVPIPPDSDFPLENLPFGVFRTSPDADPRVGVAIGDHILDLYAVHRAGILRLPSDDHALGSLNLLLAFGLAPVRRRVSELLTDGNEELDAVADRGLVEAPAVEMMLPVEVGDFVDFYTSEHHATNVGRMFRPDAPPLLPNWKHLPIGYHGRSGTIVVSGTDVTRPAGQRRGEAGPVFGPSTRLDFELEMGFVTSTPGTRMPPEQAEDHIGGFVLVNDWSARDIQGWEYQPLGPFLGKSFGTTISPWLVTPEALAPFRVPVPDQDPAPLPHLHHPDAYTYDVRLEAEINGHVVTSTDLTTSYWSPAQQLSHATSNGATTRTGDLWATGTLSGPAPDSLACLLELSWNGTSPVAIGEEKRTFLEDGDTVTIRGWCEREGAARIGFGTCEGTVRPATEERP